MKKICVPTLILFLIFSLISCGNGKNKTSKEIKTIKIENQIAQNFKIEPYPWVAKKSLVDKKTDTTIGSWEYVTQEIERLKKVKNIDERVGSRPILFLEVQYITANNIRHKPIRLTQGYYLPKSETVFLDKGGIRFEKNKEYEVESLIKYYNENDESIKNDINLLIKVISGSSNFKRDFGINLFKRFKEKDYNITSDVCPDFFRVFPLNSKFEKIDGDYLIKGGYPKKEFFLTNDLSIKEIDIYGNVLCKWGKQEIIVPVRESRQSELIEKDYPRHWFKYDWPKYKDGKWVYSKKSKITISGDIVEKVNQGTIYEATTVKWKEGFDLETDDPFLIKKAIERKSYNSTEIKEIIEYIKGKYPKKEIKMNYDADEYSIILCSYKRQLKKYLPTMGNPKFVTQIRIINHGWMVYYY